MDAEPNTELNLTIDGRTVIARTSPEDEGPLAALLRDRKSITIRQSEADTEGHLLFNEVAIDVEGHAMTLRLPNAADAAAVRRVLAVGALTASIAVGGVLASSMVQPQTAVPVPGAARVTTQVQPQDQTAQHNLGNRLQYGADQEVFIGDAASAAAAAGAASAQDQAAQHNLGNRAQYGEVGIAEGASAAAAAGAASAQEQPALHNLGNRLVRDTGTAEGAGAAAAELPASQQDQPPQHNLGNRAERE